MDSGKNLMNTILTVIGTFMLTAIAGMLFFIGNGFREDISQLSRDASAFREQTAAQIGEISGQLKMLNQSMERVNTKLDSIDQKLPRR